MKNTIPVPFKLWYVLDSCIVNLRRNVLQKSERPDAVIPQRIQIFAMLLSLLNANHFQRFNSINLAAHQLWIKCHKKDTCFDLEILHNYVKYTWKWIQIYWQMRASARYSEETYLTEERATPIVILKLLVKNSILYLR